MTYRIKFHEMEEREASKKWKMLMDRNWVKTFSLRLSLFLFLWMRVT